MLGLPVSLLALLSAYPAFAVPTTFNDPFHDIAALVPKPPEQPICCLRPLPPLEPPTEDEDVLLSFEDWKARRLADTKEQVAGTPLSRPGGGTDVALEPGGTDATALAQQPWVVGGQQEIEEVDSSIERSLSPHFRIPITDRFNYASLDCSARVHSAHRSAQSPSSILSSKKDRYMLSPCSEEKQFVVVELCEDIRIDTVQLANYEFFSGVFKDFTVSVAKTYTAEDDGWIVAGTYRAKNLRGVQSFHPPMTLRDFYRFIRIDFHSHYGNEYYCPLSLLRVYGLTHLEEWKWEMWEAESRAKRTIEESYLQADTTLEPYKSIQGYIKVHSSPIFSKNDSVSPTSSSTASSSETVAASSLPEFASASSSPDSTTITSTSSHTPDLTSHITPAVVTHSQTSSTMVAVSASSGNPRSSSTLFSSETASPSESVDYSQLPVSHSSSVSYSSSDIPSASTSHSPQSSPHPQSNNTSAEATVANVEASLRSSRASSSTSHAPAASSVHVSSAAYPPPLPTGGESIYRTIMNRLTALEANTTLYTRYVDEQISGVREVLRRLGEDVGRLDGLGKAQAQSYQRSLTEFEKQRRQMEFEHDELMKQVHHLAAEVVLEKRLGIAQLCLLLAVLVFMALTRGSRGEPLRASSVRDWGRRTLSISGGWVSRFRSRSRTPSPSGSPSLSAEKPRVNVHEFPSHSSGGFQRSKRAHAVPIRRTGSHPRTPMAIRTPTTFRHHQSHNRPIAHTAVPFLSASNPVRPPLMQRASSGGAFVPGFGGVGPVPKSAKKWARSAHLHEVKMPAGPSSGSAKENLGLQPEGEGEGASRNVDTSPVVAHGDIFSPELDSKGKGKGKDVQRSGSHPRRPLTPLTFSPSSDLPLGCARNLLVGDADAGDGGEVWVDTDAEQSDSESSMGHDRTFVSDAS